MSAVGISIHVVMGGTFGITGSGIALGLGISLISGIFGTSRVDFGYSAVEIPLRFQQVFSRIALVPSPKQVL